MSFFDSKQEVINIELTQYGKELFSKGLFKPAYYSFYDDDIIYDLSWGGVKESQNEIETRIFEESIYMKPIYNFSDRIKNNEKYEFFKSEPMNHSRPKNSNNLSTNNSITKYIPAWDIKIYNGSALSYDTSSYENILQINLSKSFVEVKGDSIDNLKINVEDILIEFNEENCLSNKNNFEISLYEIDESSKDNYENSILKQISFGKEPIYIKDGVLLEQPIFPKIEAESDSTKAEYYFNIVTDKKINSLTLQDIKEKERKIYDSAIVEENK